MADMHLVSDKFDESLSTRAEALGCKLMTDNSEGEYPLYYIYEEEVGKLVLVSVPADQVDHWLRDRELLARTNGTTFDTKNDLADVRDIFQGIEASAKLLSMHVDLADLDTDLVAAVMVISREADHGRLIVGEIMESAKGGAS